MIDVPEFCIICDTRESKPYNFLTVSSPPPKTIRKKLDTGDYSILGMEESGITIERKSLIDLFGSVGKNRKRLEAEFVRMRKFDYAGIVIESSLSDIFNKPPSRSKMNPKAVFRTIISWSVRYNVHVWPMWNREAAEKTTFLLLKNYYDNYYEDWKKL